MLSKCWKWPLFTNEIDKFHFVSSSTQDSPVCQNLLIDSNSLQVNMFPKNPAIMSDIKKPSQHTKQRHCGSDGPLWRFRKRQSWYDPRRTSSYTVTENLDEAYPSVCVWVKSSSETRETCSTSVSFEVTTCPVVNSHTDGGCSGVETEIEVVKVPTSMVFY